MHLGIIVDHPKRDLPGAVMIARAAADRGMTASLVPLYEQATDVPLLGLDALVVNHARPANFELLQNYARLGIAVFVLDTEGGILAPGALHLSTRILRDSGCAAILSGYLCWGDRQREAFVADGAMPADRIFATGCPRFDFASARWSELLDFPLSDYVLINANFSLVNSRFTRSAEEEHKAVVDAGWDGDYIQGIVIDQKAILARFLETVRAAALANPDQLFVVRPHPFERESLYAESFANLPNVKIHGAGSVLNALRHARAVLHVNCGTSVEAIMLGRLPVSMEFLNTDRMRRHIPLPSAISLRAGSFEELDRILKDISRAAEAFDFAGTYRTHIHPWFHANDGRASERLVDAVAQAAPPHPRNTRSIAMALRGARSNVRFLQALQNFLSNVLGSRLISEARASFRPRRREKLLSQHDVENLLLMIRRHQGCPPFAVARARHPLSGLPLGSLRILGPGADGIGAS